MYARARVSLVSWEGGSHVVLFMVSLGLPSARPMVQALYHKILSINNNYYSVL